MSYQAVIFDLDGTLVNSLEDLADSTNMMLSAYALPQHPIEKYNKFVGNGLRNLVIQTLPEDKANDKEFVDKALDKMKEIYAGRLLNKTRAYPGIRETLTKLMARDIKMAVCTNKPMDAAKMIISILFEPNTFQYVIGDRPGYPRKPDPTNVLQIAKAMGVEPADVVYVGDSDVDMKTAINAGFLPVGATWGFRSAEELKANGAKVLIDKPSELLFTVIAKK